MSAAPQCDSARFAARRARLAEAMRAEGGGVALIASAPQALRNGDTEHRYRFDSSFYYLSGFREPEAILVLIADAEETRSLLFCREKNPAQEIWEGTRHGPDAAREHFGFDAAYPMSTFADALDEVLAERAAVFCMLGRDRDFDQRILRCIETLRERAHKGPNAPRALRDLHPLVDALRLHKDDYEIAAMRHAANISAQAHERAMRFVRPGHFEYHIEAELLHAFLSAGADGAAYPCIVAGGANACTLHHVENRARLEAGTLLLVDAGCEYQGYAADITRSYPVSGRFSGAQRAVYEVVLAAQLAAIACIRPGQAYNAGHEAALQVLTQGLVDLGLLQGNVDGLIESGAYKRFYMHSTGHWLGLDVHDVGRYKLDGAWRPLAAGQVLTVEPGLYLRAADDIPPAFWDIGIRIEDDVLVTATGHEVLSAAAVKDIAGIEALMCATEP